MENVADLMASYLTPESLSATRAIGAAAEAAHVVPFLVGGSVRDLISGRADSVDIDITLVGADVTTFVHIAELAGGQISRRSQFATAKLRLDSLEVDLAMARAEEYRTPGSLPVVRNGTLEEDLSRRDFSVNAMAVSLSAETWGDVKDLHHGLDDLRDGRLRILHDRSFRDDPTRILRAARYISRLALSPTSGTLDALLESVRFLDRVSPARVRNELERVFLERNTSGAMKYLSEWGVLAAVLPFLSFREGAWRRFDAEDVRMSPEKRVSLGYAILSCGMSEADVNGLVVKLNPGSSARRSIQEAAALSRAEKSNLTNRSNSELATVLDPVSEPSVLGVALTLGGELGCRIFRYLRCHRGLRPQLTGDDLIEMGVPEGPAVGSLLERLRSAWLDGELSSPSQELTLAQRLVREAAET